MTFGSVAATNAPPIGLFGTVNTTSANTTTPNAFSFGANKPATDTKPSLFSTPTTQSGLGAFSAPAFGQTTTTPAFGQTTTTPAFGQTTATPAFGQTNPPPSFGSITNAATTTASTSLFGNAAQNTPIFGSSNTSATQPKVENAFGMSSNPSNSTPVFGSQNPSSTFGSSMNPPAFGSSNNVFGSTPATQSQPAFGSSTNLFSTPATTTQQNSTFGSASGVFAFGQGASQPPATTASTGMFVSTNTNTNTNTSSPFVFGQGNTAASNQAAGIFGAKPTENANTNSALTAPPAFGSTSPAFNFSAKPVFGSQAETKPPSFSFNAQNNAPTNVSAFGSAPAAPPSFGSQNGMGMDFHLIKIENAFLVS